MVQTGVKMKKARPNRIAVLSAWHVCLQKPKPWQMQVRLFVEKILKTTISDGNQVPGSKFWL